jgi:hypothetical protein
MYRFANPTHSLNAPTCNGRVSLEGIFLTKAQLKGIASAAGSGVKTSEMEIGISEDRRRRWSRSVVTGVRRTSKVDLTDMHVISSA